MVPEIASREHVRQVLPTIDEALRQAGVTLADLGAVAVATGPGLVGALVVGLTAAKSLALALEIPLIAVDHLECHLYACQLAYPDREVFPCLGLVVSGGHTSLFLCQSPLDYEFLGGTTDDAAGEAFDKVASLLGLGYPGGPAIEQAARAGNPGGLCLPPVVLARRSAHLELFRPENGRAVCTRWTERSTGSGRAGRRAVNDVAASFQEAVVDVIVAKTRQALSRTSMKRLGVGGGVAANSRLRKRLNEMADELGVDVFIPPLALCTDNAAMAGIALPKLAAGHIAGLDIDVSAGLVRPTKK